MFNADGTVNDFDAQHVLYRSDTAKPLSVVHKSYKVVQPHEVVRFFADLIDLGNLKIETAGSLFDGKKIWALASLNKNFNLGDGDIVKNYVLLASSCDRSIATTGRLTNVRVVCNNTLTWAYANNENMVKVSHRSKFDEDQQQDMKVQLGLLGKAAQQSRKQLIALTETKVKPIEAVAFFLRVLNTSTKKDEIDLENIAPRAMKKIWDAYHGSPGANKTTAKGTLWGAVNAISFVTDHNTSAHGAESRLNSAWFGPGQALKVKAVDLAMSVADGYTDLMEGIGDTAGNVLKVA